MGVRNTDNDQFAANPWAVAKFGGIAQLSLPLNVTLAPPEPTEEERKQQANKEALFEALRIERDMTVAIARYLFPELTINAMVDIPNGDLAIACEAYRAITVIKPPVVPHPELWGSVVPDEDATVFVERKPPKERVYQPWTEERKQRTAVSKLKARAVKRFSFPDLWIEFVQAEVLKDPWRFGVCPLPGVNESCVIPNPELVLMRQQAIAREIQFREQEQGLVQPVSLPVNLKAKEPSYVLPEPIHLTA